MSVRARSGGNIFPRILFSENFFFSMWVQPELENEISMIIRTIKIKFSMMRNSKFYVLWAWTYWNRLTLKRYVFLLSSAIFKENL